MSGHFVSTNTVIVKILLPKINTTKPIVQKLFPSLLALTILRNLPFKFSKFVISPFRKNASNENSYFTEQFYLKYWFIIWWKKFNIHSAILKKIFEKYFATPGNKASFHTSSSSMWLTDGFRSVPISGKLCLIFKIKTFITCRVNVLTKFLSWFRT